MPDVAKPGPEGEVLPGCVHLPVSNAGWRRECQKPEDRTVQLQMSKVEVVKDEMVETVVGNEGDQRQVR